MLIRKSYRYRIYPTAEQAGRLVAWQHVLRWLWNLALEQRHHALRRYHKRYLTAFDQIGELKALRAEVPWLADVPRNVCAQLLVELDRAWQRCFKRLAFAPRYKRRGRDTVNPCEPHPKVWRLAEDGLVFPKLGRLRIVLHRPLVGTPKTCSIVQDGDRWFAAISCEAELDEPLTRTTPTVALDRGVVNLVADSDGHLVPNPRYLQATLSRLAHAQRTVSRRKKGSRNRERAKIRVAHLHRTARCQRDHFLHCLSTAYAKSHGTVVVERLQVRNMVRSKLARSILDAGWGRLVSMLRYKLAWSGGRLVEVPAAYSSQTCAACGSVDAASRASQAEFICTACGVVEHADLNAACVLLQRHLAVEATVTACGGLAHQGHPMKQELRVVRRGQRTQGLGFSKAPAFRPG